MAPRRWSIVVGLTTTMEHRRGWGGKDTCPAEGAAGALLVQVGGVVVGAEDGRAVGVPVDLAEGGDVQVHPEERGGRGEQGRGDQGLDRGDVADDEHGLA